MNDLELVLSSARKNEPKATAALCEHYYPRVLKFMYYRVNVNDAEDLTNEVFIKMLRYISSQTGRFEPWLFKIARNLIIDKSRYSAVRPETSVDDSILSNVPSKKDEYSRVNLKMDIASYLSKLNDEQKELLSLKFIQGFSNEEISEVTGKKLGAIRAMQFRALSALKQLMQQENYRNGK